MKAKHVRTSDMQLTGKTVMRVRFAALLPIESPAFLGCFPKGSSSAMKPR